MEKDIRLFNKAKEILSSLSEEELSSRLGCLELGDERKEILFDILAGKRPIGFHTQLDVFLYVIKSLFREEFDSLDTRQHLHSSCELYEFDPPKNGQNIIKHGISFREVVSYSSKFGSLMVRCPDEKDLDRIVIFSDLSNLNGQWRLELPLNPKFKSDCYVISIIHIRNMKFRFISSRVMSKNKNRKTLKNALKNIYPNDPSRKTDFIDRCIEILDENFFESHS